MLITVARDCLSSGQTTTKVKDFATEQEFVLYGVSIPEGIILNVKDVTMYEWSMYSSRIQFSCEVYQGWNYLGDAASGCLKYSDAEAQYYFEQMRRELECIAEETNLLRKVEKFLGYMARHLLVPQTQGLL